MQPIVSNDVKTANTVALGVAAASAILAALLPPTSHLHQIAEVFPTLDVLGLDAFRNYDSSTATDLTKATSIATDSAAASQAIATLLPKTSPVFTLANLFPNLAGIGLEAFRQQTEAPPAP